MMTNFNVGNRVRVIDAPDLYDYYAIGDTGVIKNIDSGGDCWILFDEDNHHPREPSLTRDTWCASPVRLKLIDEEPEMEKVQEDKDEMGEFIVWMPDSPVPPRARYYTYKQARYVARQMSGKHNCAAYVMRAECVYHTVSKTTKEEL